jgi:hypothetical protein
MPLDLCSVTAGTERRFSFMSIAMGLMCEVDLGKISPFTSPSPVTAY